ncbi:Prophage CP4-57 regulatory protein (AlpA) [compost metagenome]
MAHKANRLVRIKAVEELTGLKKSALYELIAAGRFPRQVRLGDGKCPPVAWVLSEVEAWIAGRIAERDAA